MLISFTILGFFSSSAAAQVRPEIINPGEVKVTPRSNRIENPYIKPARASRPTYSVLVVLTEPKNAEIIIDGKSEGKAVNGVFKTELRSRKQYNVIVKAGPDYDSYSEIVNLKPRDAKIVKAPLIWKYGTVKIFPAKEGVNIFLDDQPVDAASLHIDEDNVITIKKLSPGEHKVIYDLPGYKIYKRTINISPGSTYTWNFVPERAVVEMTVTTEPDTLVYIDSEPVGKTTPEGTLKKSDVDLGKHEIKLVKDDFEDYKIVRDFEDQKPVRIDQRLVPRPTSAAFSDDFEVINQKWRLPASGAEIKSGRLFMQNALSLAYPLDIRYRDFQMHFHLKLTDAGGAAWAIRARDPGNYYLFYLSGPEGIFRNRFNTYIVIDGKFDPNKPVSSLPLIADLKAGGEYDVAIQVNKNRIEHEIKPAATGKPEKFGFYEDPHNTYPYGNVGFRTVGSERFSIDDFSVHPH